MKKPPERADLIGWEILFSRWFFKKGRRFPTETAAFCQSTPQRLFCLKMPKEEVKKVGSVIKILRKINVLYKFFIKNITNRIILHHKTGGSAGEEFV